MTFDKQIWLDIAETIDAWRLVPRTLLFSYCIWVSNIVAQVLTWYQHLPGTERSLEASGMAAAVITAVTGLATWVFKIYSDGGRDWTQTGDAK